MFLRNLFHHFSFLVLSTICHCRPSSMKRLLSRAQNKGPLCPFTTMCKKFLTSVFAILYKYEKQTRKINDQVKITSTLKTPKNSFVKPRSRKKRIFLRIRTPQVAEEHSNLPWKLQASAQRKRPQVWIHEIGRNSMHHQHDRERTEQNSKCNKKKLPNDVHVQQQEFSPSKWSKLHSLWCSDH